MRTVLALACAAALLAFAVPMPAAAQDLCAADAAYQARAGWGDVPCTEATEGAGFHVVQALTFQHTNGTASEVTLRDPAGAPAGTASCTCGPGVRDGDTVRFQVPAGQASGTHTATLTTDLPETDAVSVQLRAPQAPSHLVRLYVPDGKTSFAPSDPDGSIACAAGGCDVLSFDEPLAWFTIVPVSAATIAPPQETQNPWLFAGLGFLVGLVVWALLVSKGVVQRKRKQEVAVAAHREAAATESVQVLETRKRALMAALKEVEVARMQNEIEVGTYEQVKADLKRQTVTVLRAIEEAHAALAAKEKGAAAS